MSNREIPEEGLIPLEEEEQPEDESSDSLLKLPCVRFWQKSYNNSNIPFIILDSKLRILWENDLYSSEFNKGVRRIGEYFTKVYSSYLDEKKSSDLFRKIKSENNGFSWRGRIETGGKSYRKIIANTMIFPIFKQNTNNDAPIGYGALFDNITHDYRILIKSTFESLLEASKLKDNDTGQHISRVNAYSKTMAKALHQNPLYKKVDIEFFEDIGFLAAMHDVGKIGTPDDILNKTGPLDKREWEIMKEHTINGAYILSTYSNPMAKQIALFHHERWDGTGYPYNIAGRMIPLSARIVALADVYDALRMKRSYKEAFSHEKAAEIIIESGGTHLDPNLVVYFKKLEHRFIRIYDSLAD